MGDPGDPCVALLFPQWVLDTVPKFALGCCGVFLMGLCVEGLVKLRSCVPAVVALCARSSAAFCWADGVGCREMCRWDAARGGGMGDIYV